MLMYLYRLALFTLYDRVRGTVTLKSISGFFAEYGRDVKVIIEQPLEEELMHPGKNTVTYEARMLKALLLKLM